MKIIYQELTDLNIYFLISPERLTSNYKEYLIQIFKHSSCNDIMEICTKCIVTALKSKTTTIIQPSDFIFDELIYHVKKECFTDQTKMNFTM